MLCCGCKRGYDRGCKGGGFCAPAPNHGSMTRVSLFFCIAWHTLSMHEDPWNMVTLMLIVMCNFNIVYVTGPKESLAPNHLEEGC